MSTIPFQNEGWKKPEPSRPLATVVSAGAGAPSAQARARSCASASPARRGSTEVRVSAIAHRRTLEYSRTADRKIFMICGRVMDDNASTRR